jgi:hypothetical protein
MSVSNVARMHGMQAHAQPAVQVEPYQEGSCAAVAAG